MFGSHPKLFKSKSLEVKPRHLYFSKVPLVIGMQSGLRSTDQKKKFLNIYIWEKRNLFYALYKIQKFKSKGDHYSRGELLFNGYGVSGGGDAKFWRWTMRMVVQQCECIWCHWIVHLNIVTMTNYMLYIHFHNKNCITKHHRHNQDTNNKLEKIGNSC